jgi:hypothetical protein
MDDLSQDEKQNISKFVEYSLMLIVRGFDEMEMNQRLEFVKLFGSMIEISINKYFNKLSKLEDKICVLEDKINLLETKNKKK